MDFQLLNKYLRGEASESEVAGMFQWIEASPENRKEFIDYKKVWAISAQADESEEETWKLIFAHLFKRQKLMRFCFQLAKYAAIFLLMFGAGIGIQYLGWGIRSGEMVYQQNTTITVPPGQMTNVLLPDGSKVMLNSGSTITYNGDFSFGKRLINLSGEAFFDVAKDIAHPFIVMTPKLNFEVHGTSFNIDAYPEDKFMNATLIEGSLEVKDKSNNEIVLLVPGENARFEAITSKLSVSKVKTDMYTSWKDGLITFRNEKLKDIALIIERWYNVKIIIGNKKLGEQAYFGTILKNKPIDQILEALRLSSSFKYKIEYKPDKPTIIYWE